MLDCKALLNAILDAAQEGADATLVEIKNDARRLAPVRKLFKGGGRRQFRGPIGVTNQSVTGAPYSFAIRVARVASLNDSGKYAVLSGKTNRSRPNAAVPTTRPLKTLGGERLMGTPERTFREVRQIAKGTYAFAHTKVRYKVGGKMRLLDLRDEFLGRAASDLSRGRGIATVAGEQQYGGTLRESIKVIPTVRVGGGRGQRGNSLVGYVEASAIEHGFNYAYAQEFGTAHNRPQPYLRPAARMAVRRIAPNMKNSMATYLSKIRPGHIRLTPALFKVTAQLSGSFKVGGAGSVVTQVNNKIDRMLAIR